MDFRHVTLGAETAPGPLSAAGTLLPLSEIGRRLHVSTGGVGMINEDYMHLAEKLSDARRALMLPHPVSYTHLRAHETRHDLVCRLLLEKKKKTNKKKTNKTK